MATIPSKLPFSKKPLGARVVISYISDYVIIIALVAGFWALDAVEPYHQHFALQNYTLQYPYAVHERIPINYALLISGAFPIVVIALYTLVIDGLFSHHKVDASGRRRFNGPYRLKDRLWELNCGILGLLLAQAAAFVITGALKNATGKPRPDLIDRCRPVEGSHDPSPFGLSNSTICTRGGAILKDGFRSFPSGHSSSSFAGLFYLSLYLCGKMHVLDSRGEVWKTFIVMVPTLSAALVAVSRIMDARHHPFDVISGSMLGILCGWAAYRQYFPPVTEPWQKGRAYPIRSWGTGSLAPTEQQRLESLRNEGSEPLRVPDAEHSMAPGVYQRRTHSPDHNNPFESSPYEPNRRREAEWAESSSDDQEPYGVQPSYPMSNLPRPDPRAPRYDDVNTAYNAPGTPTPLNSRPVIGTVTRPED